jgi:hypothetical protein
MRRIARGGGFYSGVFRTIWEFFFRFRLPFVDLMIE